MSMSKSRRKTDKRQSTIFDLIKEYTAGEDLPTEGKARVIERLRASLRQAIKSSPLSRHQIAGEMSHLLNESITKEQIDSWTRESDETNKRPARHIPAEYLPAFCIVTRDNGPIEIMGEIAGAFVLPGPEALRAEIQRLDEQIKAAQARKRKRLMFLREIEGRARHGKG